MKKIILCILSFSFLVAVAGCSTANTKNKEDEKYERCSYEIRVIDIDGENIGNQTVLYEEYDTVLKALDAYFKLDYSTSQYGTFINSINGSVIDTNYYVAIYENGIMAETGVDGLIIDDNDLFEFKVECWNTNLDEIDRLVDKIIYHYAKTYMQDELKGATSYTNSNYWTMMAIDLMASNGYDKSLFNTDNLSTQYIESINNVEINSLSGANIGKYYYSIKAMGKNTASFKEFYVTYINDTISTSYNEYVTPFIMSPAYSLNVSSDRLNELINTTYVANTNWGYDGYNWQYSSLAMFNNELDKNSILSPLKKDMDNGVSTSLSLLTFAAFNESGYDVVKILLEKYYDEELCLVKWNLSDDNVVSSTNQIYASLMAYKVQRDTNNATYIF